MSASVEIFDLVSQLKIESSLVNLFLTVISQGTSRILSMQYLISYYFPVVSVSVPTMVSVGEEDGTVRVCATLSNAPSGGITIPISITLATADSSPGIEMIIKDSYMLNLTA